MNLLRTIAIRLGRTLLLLLFAAAGTILLVRFAPGYFSDDREIDARYAQVARSEIESQMDQQRSLTQVAVNELKSWLNGDFGESRQFHTPVAALVKERDQVSALLLVRGLGCGWLLALSVALPVSSLRNGRFLWSLPFTILLSIPTAAMATACILAETGGPVLVLSLFIAAREFKFLCALLERAWGAPHLLHGRAQGLTLKSLILMHLLPAVSSQLRALATLSIVTALGALIPIEVIFDVPGIGQLAWSAVMNRDLPVLVCVSLLMATVVGFAGMLPSRGSTVEAI